MPEYLVKPIMNTTSYSDREKALPENRNRPAEVYFNGMCLARSILCLEFRKAPIFLLHLWHALANEPAPRHPG